MQLVGLRALTL